MNSDTDNYEVSYCPEDDEYRVYCDNCDKLCIERNYKKHLKSGNNTKNSLKDSKSFMLFKYALAL